MKFTYSVIHTQSLNILYFSIFIDTCHCLLLRKKSLPVLNIMNVSSKLEERPIHNARSNKLTESVSGLYLVWESPIPAECCRGFPQSHQADS